MPIRKRRWVKRGTAVRKGWRRTGRFRRRPRASSLRNLTNVSRNSTAIAKFRIVCWTQVNNISGGTVSLSYGLAINFPSMHINALGTYGQMPNISNLITSAPVAGLFFKYDTYKVQKFTALFVPSFQDIERNTGVGTSSGSVYMVYDRDDVANLTEQAALDGGAIARNWITGRMISFSATPTQNQKNTWLNNAVALTYTPAIAVTGNVNMGVDPHSSVKVLFPNIIADSQIGRLYGIWDVVCKGVLIP